MSLVYYVFGHSLDFVSASRNFVVKAIFGTCILGIINHIIVVKID